MGGFPASYVSLPEGKSKVWGNISSPKRLPVCHDGSTFRRSRESSHAGGCGQWFPPYTGETFHVFFLAERIVFGGGCVASFFFFGGGLRNKHLTYTLHEFVFSF